MRRLFFILICTVGLCAGEYKAVFDLTTADLERFEMRLLSGVANVKGHYASRLDEVELAVVIHGGAYKFFVAALERSPFQEDAALAAKQKEYAARLKALHEHYGVRFVMCEVGMKKLGIDPKTLYPFVTLASSSTTALIEIQNSGFAYIPLH